MQEITGWSISPGIFFFFFFFFFLGGGGGGERGCRVNAGAKHMYRQTFRVPPTPGATSKLQNT